MRFYFICAIMSFGILGFAQNRTSDSLMLAIKNAKNDTTKISLYISLGKQLSGQNLDSSLKLYEVAKNLCVQNIKNCVLNDSYCTVLKKNYALVLSNIGVVKLRQGNPQEALSLYFNSLQIREDLKDKSGIANSLYNIGVAYQKQGDLTKAIEYLTTSVNINTEINSKRGIALALVNLASAYLDQGDIVKSLTFSNKSSEINREIGDKERLAYSLSQTGLIYYYQGDFSKSLDLYLESLRIREELNDKSGSSSSLNNIGNVYYSKGRFSEALNFYTKSLTLKESIGEKGGMAMSLNNIGAVYFSMGDAANAILYQVKSLKLKESINDKKGQSLTLCNIGDVYCKQKKYKEALFYSKHSLSIAQDLRFPSELVNATKSLYLIYLGMSAPDSAQKLLCDFTRLNNTKLNHNYSNLSEKEKELFFATMEKDYMHYYDFTSVYKTIFPNLTDTAYNISLSNKGISLKSSTAMRLSILNSGDTLLIAQYKEWLQLKKKIAKFYDSGKETQDLESRANELEKELINKSTVFSDFDKIKNLNWQQVQKGLKKGEAAIEFIHFKSEIDTLHPTKYAALIVKPESVNPEMISLCNETDLETILGAIQGNNVGFVNKVYGTKKQAETILYEKIWKPIEQSLKDVSVVYYSPTGLLHKISFSAISKGKNSFLCDKYSLNQQSSTGRVAFPDNLSYCSSDQFLLVGGVKYNSDTTKKETWTYLPGTLTETEEISALLKKKNHRINYLVASNANETNFKRDIAQAEILHVATHGFFFPDPEKVKEELKVTQTKEENLVFRGTTDYANWSFVNNKNPLMRSGIVLAGANDVWERDPMAEGEDGVLTAQEVSNMDMRKTKLVVLSACETGLGDIKGSEGVYGLQRAFKMAGVNYIVMSLWQVPDKETSEFMINFYKKLTAEKDVKKAFHATQKEMRKKYDPYYWAAFVLVE